MLARLQVPVRGWWHYGCAVRRLNWLLRRGNNRVTRLIAIGWVIWWLRRDTTYSRGLWIAW